MRCNIIASESRTNQSHEANMVLIYSSLRVATIGTTWQTHKVKVNNKQITTLFSNEKARNDINMKVIVNTKK